MDDYEKLLMADSISPQLKKEIRHLNKRQNRLINKVSNIIRSIKGNNFVEPAKLMIALDNINAYFEELRCVNDAQSRLLMGLLKRCYRIEEEKTEEQAGTKNAEDIYNEPKEYSDSMIKRTYRYYNRAFPKLDNFRPKKRK